MNLVDPLIQELKQEASVTRKVIERIPETDLGWKPHEKSMSMGELASHVADTFGWVAPTLDEDEMDMATSDYKPFLASTKAELLEVFDKNLEEALKSLVGRSNEVMLGVWTMKMNGETVFAMPRVGVIKVFMVSHQIHHRGQLTVYLRMRDVPLPQVYGPTADEPEMFPVGE